jgi:hypothetical protein
MARAMMVPSGVTANRETGRRNHAVQFFLRHGEQLASGSQIVLVIFKSGIDQKTMFPSAPDVTNALLALEKCMPVTRVR